VLPSSALTPKDAEDLAFGVKMGVDYVALSFVQMAEDVRQARDALAHAGAAKTMVVSKLERPEAVERIDDILQASDAVMIARGDLGLELPLERVPRVQKEVTRKARSFGIPVIVSNCFWGGLYGAVFGLAMPQSVPGVPTEVLDPRSTWSDPAAYDQQAKKLAAMFRTNFEKFGTVPAEIRNAGPQG